MFSDVTAFLCYLADFFVQVFNLDSLICNTVTKKSNSFHLCLNIFLYRKDIHLCLVFGFLKLVFIFTKTCPTAVSLLNLKTERSRMLLKLLGSVFRIFNSCVECGKTLACVCLFIRKLVNRAECILEFINYELQLTLTADNVFLCTGKISLSACKVCTASREVSKKLFVSRLHLIKLACELYSLIIKSLNLTCTAENTCVLCA